jgi:predicted enzyme related to lactoylglutathione lyase
MTTRIQTIAITVFVALLLPSAGYAQVTLNSVRIAAKDTVAVAKFYQAAFGMQEVNRIDARTGDLCELRHDDRRREGQ